MILLEIMLPYPPSVNTIWHSVGKRWYLTAKARHYKESVGFLIKSHLSDVRWIFKGMVSIERHLAIDMRVYPPDKRKRDLDNCSKMVLDSLKGVVFVDDVQIKHLVMTMEDEIVKGGQVKLVVSDWRPSIK